MSISIPAGCRGTRSDRADNRLSCGGNLPDGLGFPLGYLADRVHKNYMLVGYSKDNLPFELALNPRLLLNHVFYGT